MSKANLALGDFVIAARTAEPKRVDDGKKTSGTIDSSLEGAAAERTDRKVLPKLSEDARRQKETAQAIVKEDARVALRNLKRAKEREAKFYVNVALNYETKARLKKAAHENDVNMTIIMQVAIDAYLKENGY